MAQQFANGGQNMPNIPGVNPAMMQQAAAQLGGMDPA